MHIRILTCLLIMLTAWSSSRGATPAAVQQSIEKARQFLYSQQSEGNWEAVRAPVANADRSNDTDGLQWGGSTAAVVYALLASGENWQDARLKPAIEFLKKADLKGTYALGMRLQVWPYLPNTPETRALAKKDADELLDILYKTGSHKGHWGYNKGATSYAISRTQYGVLGLWAAAQCGTETPSATWKMIEDALLAKQESDGGWRYQDFDRYNTTPGMTAVGVASLFITQDMLHPDAGIACKGNVSNQAIDKGLAWMASHMNLVATSERYERAYMGVTLYAVERIGVAGGLRYIGNIDWFKKGSDFLIEEQRRDGAWKMSGAIVPMCADTALGILFLARGRAPVVLGKLDYTDAAGKKPANWNQRPRDAANLARYTGRNIERDLTWQVMNLSASANDMNDASILYISGNEVIDLPAEQKDKLRTYIEQGGLILGQADCGSVAFTGGFRKLASALFPKYEFRELPADHPIYTNQQFVRAKWKTKPTVLGVSNGARELMLLIPTADAAKSWQLNSIKEKEELFQLGSNIILYTVDKQHLRYRGDSHLIARDAKITADKTIKLARLEYADGNWNPEAGGWKRLSNQLLSSAKIDLQVSPVKLGAAPLEGYDIAHLTGTGPIKLDDKSREELKKFIASGKLLVIDAAGGNGTFCTAVEAMLASMGLEKLQPLPLEHPIYSAGKNKLTEVQYRTFARSVVGNRNKPNLQAISKDGKLQVIYSREDLSVGLVGQSVDGIVGYEPDDALELMSRIMMYGAVK